MLKNLKNKFVKRFTNSMVFQWRKLKNNMLLSKFIIVVIVFFLMSILFFPLFISIDKVETYSKIILNITLSFGAFFGGLGGLKLMDDFLKQKKIELIIKELQELYPISKFGDSFDLVESEEAKGMIFIRNKITNNLHHIGNRWTLRDLGFYVFKVITLSKEEFERYHKGERYLTRGEIGE